MTDDLSRRARTVPRFKKERFLLALSEDDFRDRVVRPLFLRLGFGDGRDLCGPHEQGKDALFVYDNPLGTREVHVLQTKKGSLNLARKASQNIVEATTQLRTALQTRVILSPSKEKRFPAKAYLCASGKINPAARVHIAEEITDPRVEFLDSDDLIPKLDDHYPELWFSIDPELRPYLRALRTLLLEADDDVLPTGIGHGAIPSAVSDEMFVDLQLHRAALKTRRSHGKVEQVPFSDDLPVVGVLSRRERLILITGDGGAGKSTALRRLALVLIERSQKSEVGRAAVPILLRATSILDPSFDGLVESAANETCRLNGSDRPSFSADDLSAGRVTILLDALDELSDDGARAEALARVARFHETFPLCQVIVTSREYAFLGVLPALKPFVRFRIVPITHRQVEQILRRVQSSSRLPSTAAKEILRRIEQVHGLQLNPLLVAVFASTTDYSRKDVPANITELFKKYTEMMLGRWDATKGIGQQFQAPLKDFVLCQVAFEMHRRRVTQLDVEEFGRLVRSQLDLRGHQADADRLVDELVNRSGLFRIAEGAISFRHLLLQEFFAGRGISSSDFLESVISDSWWQRAAVFYFGQNPGDARTLDALVSAVKSRPSLERFGAAVAIGLAIQACYLVELKHKITVVTWVIETLSEAKDDFLAKTDSDGVRPITAFAWYYLFGRDATACSLPEDARVEMLSALLSGGSEQSKETKRFWAIVSLLENGLVDEAADLVKKYKPEDPRHLLGIHLGCFLLEHLRVADAAQRTAARQIRAKLNDRISHLRQQLFEEYRSELLEIQQGTITALPAPESE